MVKKNYDNMLSRFHLILERHGQTDRQTDSKNCYYQYRIPFGVRPLMEKDQSLTSYQLLLNQVVC